MALETKHTIELTGWELVLIRVALAERRERREQGDTPEDAICAEWCDALWTNLLMQEYGHPAEVWTLEVP